jgi:hypothetical protein
MIDVGIAASAVWTEDVPLDVSFLPPLLRRRCSRLTRMMLHAAARACPAEERSDVPLVFASRYGDMATTAALLSALARREPVTAAAFSHSVHNAQAGVFSIATKNRAPASAVAAGGDTFGAAFLDAVVVMRRRREARVLLVVGDDRLPEPFSPFEEPLVTPYAVALLLTALGGHRLTFTPGIGALPGGASPPHALEFVRWLEGDGDTLTLGARAAYTWRRFPSS